jgi:hypothetical protein
MLFYLFNYFFAPLCAKNLIYFLEVALLIRPRWSRVRVKPIVRDDKRVA